MSLEINNSLPGALVSSTPLEATPQRHQQLVGGARRHPDPGGNNGKVTIATVARDAGVSLSTASYVLRGRARDMRISDRTSQRVLRAAQRLRYVPNAAARSLRRRRTGFIGLLFPKPLQEWTHHVMRGIRDTLFEEAGYLPLIAAEPYDATWEAREIHLFEEQQVEAIICNPMTESPNYARLLEHGTPLVFVGHGLTNHPQVSVVAWDARAAARAAVLHLIETGRRRIAFLGGEIRPTVEQDRYAGYADALREAGLEENRNWVIHTGPSGAARSAVWQLFAAPGPRPDAVFAEVWNLALSAMDALDGLGLRIPGDVALMAMGDDQALRLARTGITTVLEPAGEVGREAALTAMELIRAPSRAPIRRLIKGYEIKSRKTTLPTRGAQ